MDSPYLQKASHSVIIVRGNTHRVLFIKVDCAGRGMRVLMSICYIAERRGPPLWLLRHVECEDFHRDLLTVI